MKFGELHKNGGEMRGARTNVQVYGCGAVFSALPMTYVSGLFFSCKSVSPIVSFIKEISGWFPVIREDCSKSWKTDLIF